MAKVNEWKTAISTDATDLISLQHMIDCGITAMELSVSAACVHEIDWQGLRDHAAAVGMEVWSYHLPFADAINIAAPDESARAAAVARQCWLIDLANAIGVRRFVIHPSAEPIPDDERSAWMASAKKSLAELAEYAAARDSVICVEDLPRTCLGHTADEMLELIAVDDRLRVCFDVNHLCTAYGCTHAEFVEKLGDKIVTTHMSDYDFIDEKHFFPGVGLINWKSLIELLEDAGYDGPFLYEGGFSPSHWAPEKPYGTIETARERHMTIKELTGAE